MRKAARTRQGKCGDGREAERDSQGRTRQRVLDAAHALFDEHGLEGATFRQLAERIDIAAAINYHFRPKDDILCAVVVPYLAEFDDLLDRSPPSNSPARRRQLLARMRTVTMARGCVRAEPRLRQQSHRRRHPRGWRCRSLVRPCDRVHCRTRGVGIPRFLQSAVPSPAVCRPQQLRPSKRSASCSRCLHAMRFWPSDWTSTTRVPGELQRRSGNAEQRACRNWQAPSSVHVDSRDPPSRSPRPARSRTYRATTLTRGRPTPSASAGDSVEPPVHVASTYLLP